MGLLAKTGHSVVVRQTLAGMTCGMVEEQTLVPKPDYWNSLMWRRLMGQAVFDVRKSGDNAEKLRIYDHATRSAKNGFAVLAINLDHERPAQVFLPDFKGRPFSLYRINGTTIVGKEVQLNGQVLKVVDDQTLPEIKGFPRAASDNPQIAINPLSYVFTVFD